MLVQKENVQLDIKPSELEKYKTNGFKEVKAKDILEDVLAPKSNENQTDLGNELDSELEEKEDLEDVLNPKTKKNK